jgi:hypothetical protein
MSNLPIDTTKSQEVPKQWKFRIVDVPAVGNCMFESVGRTLKIDARHLRQKCVDWMRTPDRQLHGESLANWIQWNTGLKVEDYARKMERDGEWGGGTELAILSSMYNTAIVVYSRDKSTEAKRIAEFVPDGVKDPASVPAICILYVNRAHYMQMLAIEK